MGLRKARELLMLFSAGRFPAACVLAAAMLFAGSWPASAEKRMALVVGVDQYANLGQSFQLQKAINDSDALGVALSELGFEVITARNPGLEEMIDKVNTLASRIQPGDTIFFFFSGHGLSPDGVNLLLPSDMPRITDRGQVGKQLVRKRAYAELEIINSFRSALTDEKSGQQRGVIIFVSDACRNNPFAERGADPTKSLSGRGIGVEPKGAIGVFSIYSAGIGQEALDRLSDDDPSPNSVFMRVFLGELTRPGVQLGDVVVNTREHVAELAATYTNSETGRQHRQTPAYYDETTGGRIYLAGLPAAVSASGDSAGLVALEEFLRAFGATHGSTSYDAGSRTVLINDISVKPSKPGDPSVRLGRLALSGATARTSEQFAANRVEIKNAEFLFGGKTLQIDNLTLAAVALAPPALQLLKVADANGSVRSSDREAVLPDSLTKLAEGIEAIQFGKLEIRGVKFQEAVSVLALKAINASTFANGKFGDIVFEGLSLVPPAQTVRADRVVLKGLDLAGVLRKATKSPSPSASDFGAVLDGIELHELTAPDERSGQTTGQQFHIETAQASWGQVLGGIPTTAHFAAKATIPILPSDGGPLKLLREAGRNSYSVAVDIGGRWNETSQTFVLAPATLAFDDLFFASAVLTIDNVLSSVFVSDLDKFNAAAAVLEAGPIELAVRDTGGVSLLVEQHAKAENLSPDAARKQLVENLQQAMQAKGGAEIQRFGAALGQFIASPGATLKIILTPKERVSVVNALSSMKAGPGALLEQFNLGTLLRPSNLEELKKSQEQMAALPPKSLDRIPAEKSVTGEPVVSSPPAGKAPPVIVQPAVLFEEDQKDTQGRRYAGTATWRAETIVPSPGLAPEVAVRAEIEIPDRRMNVTLSLRRNSDKGLPASHTIEILFKLPVDSPGGGVREVPGILMKSSEQARGTAFAGLSVKVTNGYFLFGLSAVDADMTRNLELLKDRPWLDIPIVYNNGDRAILAIQKGSSGERALAEAFIAWER